MIIYLSACRLLLAVLRPALEYRSKVWEADKSQAATLESVMLGEAKRIIGCSSRTCNKAGVLIHYKDVGISPVHNTTLVQASRRQRSWRRSPLICELSSVYQCHQTLADARIGNSFIRASLAQRLANQIAQNIHVTDSALLLERRAGNNGGRRDLD